MRVRTIGSLSDESARESLEAGQKPSRIHFQRTRFEGVFIFPFEKRKKKEREKEKEDEEKIKKNANLDSLNPGGSVSRERLSKVPHDLSLSLSLEPSRRVTACSDCGQCSEIARDEHERARPLETPLRERERKREREKERERDGGGERARERERETPRDDPSSLSHTRPPVSRSLRFWDSLYALRGSPPPPPPRATAQGRPTYVQRTVNRLDSLLDFKALLQSGL